MANPNIVNVTAITGVTVVNAISTSGNTVVSNAAASNQVFKLNSLYISNVNGFAATTVNVSIQRSSINYRMAYLMSVPAASSLDLLSKSVYLNEGDSLVIQANTANYIESVVSYEVIS